MRISISVERLRVWLLVGAGLLVMVIAAFLGYAHYRAHRFLTELPGKLGVDVTRETNAFTYSQSLGGRTVYTIHAAKAVQHKDGKYTLHDVGIVVYGRTSDRADRIYGSEFQYDQKAGVARAMGEVHLDLEAPAPVDAPDKREYAAGVEPSEEHETADPRMIHVKTSDLVFMQKAGTAETDREIEFEFHGMTGHAMGADYDSGTGVVVLHSAVNVVGVQQGKPVSLTASRAELDRPKRRVVLSQAKYTMAGDTRMGSGESARAQRAVVHLRENGSVERLEAMGAVTLTDGNGSKVVAPKGDLLLDAENTPQSAVLVGGVRYVADGPLRQAQGEAAQGRAVFDLSGKLKHLTLTEAVELHERVRTSASDAWSKRDLTAGAVELAFSSDLAGKAQLQDARATGNARLMVVSSAGKTGSGETASDLEGGVLTAHLTPVNGVQRLAAVNGTGHTLLRRVRPDGAVNTSSGDALEVHFRQVNNSAGRTADEISTAVQEGNVIITQKSAKKSKGAPQEQRATAARAAYNGARQQLVLTGNVQLTDAESILWADSVAIAKTGNAEADGTVKASYKLPGSGSETVHVTATRAILKHDEGHAIFYGAENKPARLWQGASQVEAPVLQFEQKQRRLLAQDNRQGASMDVHTVLGNGGPGKASPKKTQVVRVVSGELTYSDATREAKFTGGVQVENADGHMKGQEAVVYLQPERKIGQDSAAGQITNPGGLRTAEQDGFMGGNVERVVATGHIEIDQPGRRATGERVVYTASDGLFVMTGTSTSPPKIVDEARGTITGKSLRFHAGDESAVVFNGAEGGQRVRTETRVKKE